MIISLEQVKQYSRCPQYFRFKQTAATPPRPTQSEVVVDVIKKAYVAAANTGHKADWRRLLGWVDKKVFQRVDFEDEGELKRARSLSEAALLALSSWYHNLYLLELPFAQVDVPVGFTVSGDVVVQDRIPVVKLDEIPTIMMFTDFVPSKSSLYNDIMSRGLAALLADAVECKKVNVQQLAVGKRGKLDYEEVQINNEAHRRVLERIAGIASLIKADMIYPSVTDMCTICPFVKECVL